MNYNSKDIQLKSPLVKWGAIALAVVFAIIILPMIGKLITGIISGAVVSIILLFLAWNYEVLWSIFKSVSWSLTKKYIRVNKIEVIRQYIELQEEKAKEIKDRADKVSGTRVALGRKIEEAQNKIHNHVMQINTLQRRGGMDLAVGELASKVATDEEFIKNLQPQYDNLKEYETSMKEMYVLLRNNLEKRRYDLDSKIMEYETMKDIAKVSGYLTDFLKGKSKDAKMYDESLRMMEEDTSLYTAKVENFVSEFNPMLEMTAVNNETNVAKGLELVEKYKQELKL